MQAARGRGVLFLLIPDLGTTWGEWWASCPGRALPQERIPSTHWLGGWVGLRAGLYTEARGKSFVSPGYRIPVVRSVVRHYTDWASQCFLFSVYFPNFLKFCMHFSSLRSLLPIPSILSSLISYPVTVCQRNYEAAHYVIFPTFPVTFRSRIKIVHSVLCSQTFYVFFLGRETKCHIKQQ
jgi:hypothetical protein